MLHHNLLRNYADELGCPKEELKSFLNEFLHRDSIVKDWQQFLAVCVGTTNPKAKEQKVTSFLIKNLEGDLVKTISNLLYNLDPCFTLLTLFNAIDILKMMKQISGSLHPRGRKSFSSSGVLLGEHPLTMERGQVPDPRLNAYEQCYEFLNSLVVERTRGDENELESLFLAVIEEAHFLTFNITAFRNLADKWSYTPIMRKKAINLAVAVNDSFLKHRTEITECQYWTYYILVEKLRGRYGLRGAFREVGKRLEKLPRTIEKRYFEKKKELKKGRLLLESIIKKYNLGRALNDLPAE